MAWVPFLRTRPIHSLPPTAAYNSLTPAQALGPLQTRHGLLTTHLNLVDTLVAQRRVIFNSFQTFVNARCTTDE
jgi:hypothetical protein